MAFRLLLLLASTLHSSYALNCACARNSIDLTDFGMSATRSLQRHGCIPFQGVINSVNGTIMASVIIKDELHNDVNVWLELNSFYLVPYRDNCSRSTHLSTCPNIVSREGWGARAPTQPLTRLGDTPSHVYVHHGTGSACHTNEECQAILRSYQNYHMDDRGWWDIGYSFVIGEDGFVYEGRGWDNVGAHTLGHNSIGLGICMIGDFRKRVPNDAAMTSLKQLIECGVANKKITADYTVQGHCDVVANTECPGQSLLNLISTWEHYQSGNQSHCVTK